MRFEIDLGPGPELDNFYRVELHNLKVRDVEGCGKSMIGRYVIRFKDEG